MSLMYISLLVHFIEQSTFCLSSAVLPRPTKGMLNLNQQRFNSRSRCLCAFSLHVGSYEPSPSQRSEKARDGNSHPYMQLCFVHLRGKSFFGRRHTHVVHDFYPNTAASGFGEQLPTLTRAISLNLFLFIHY
jgi:hypothetical protein